MAVRELPHDAQTRAGTFVRVKAGGETFYAFHPRALPPDPPLELDESLHRLLESANQALGRLDGVTLLLPNPGQFLYSYIRKEAVLSSQIEGTQSSLSDLLLFEHDAVRGVPDDDVRETANYIVAMDHGLARLRGGFPLSLRLIREVHERLLTGVRGSARAPGEFRRSENWIGGTRPGDARYVPPPPHELMSALGDLEKFLHDDPVATPTLIKAALAHAQFETIHPFLDGNGRVGRLLVTLLLCEGDDPVLQQPLLYLSLYLKRNREEYYTRLQRVRTHGEWEGWLQFFLQGVLDVSRSATETTRAIVGIIGSDRQNVMTLGRAAASAARLHELVSRTILFSIPEAARSLGLSEVTVGKAAAHLEGLGIVREVTGRRRNRIYVYGGYLELLQEGTQEPPG